jgi:hypothetical protein
MGVLVTISTVGIVAGLHSLLAQFEQDVVRVDANRIRRVARGSAGEQYCECDHGAN